MGFLRPCSDTVREFLLQCMRQGPRPQSMKVRGAGGWAPWGAQGKRRPVLTSMGLGPCHPHPRESSFSREYCGVMCVGICVCMGMGSYGLKCPCVCVYWICMGIHLCMCTLERQDPTRPPQVLDPACPRQALRMLVERMHIHSAEAIRAILDQLCHSSVLEVSSRAARCPCFCSTRTGLGDGQERWSVPHASPPLPSAPL